MGRKKKFEKDLALDKAMRLFWEKGYDNTSLQELLEAMEILNGSFYNTFESKENLFKLAVGRYGQLAQDRMAFLRQSESFKGGIKAFFKHFYKLQKNDVLPRGCLVSKSIRGTASNEDLTQWLEESLSATLKAFKDQIEKSKSTGEIKSSVNSKDLAYLIFSHLQGQIKLADLGFPLQSLERQTDIFIDSVLQTS